MTVPYLWFIRYLEWYKLEFVGEDYLSICQGLLLNTDSADFTEILAQSEASV